MITIWNLSALPDYGREARLRRHNCKCTPVICPECCIGYIHKRIGQGAWWCTHCDNAGSYLKDAAE